MERAVRIGKSGTPGIRGGRAVHFPVIRTLRRRLRTKRRSRFPFDSGTSLDLSQEFPGWDPELWIIALQRDILHL